MSVEQFIEPGLPSFSSDIGGLANAESRRITRGQNIIPLEAKGPRLGVGWRTISDGVLGVTVAKADGGLPSQFEWLPVATHAKVIGKLAIAQGGTRTSIAIGHAGSIGAPAVAHGNSPVLGPQPYLEIAIQGTLLIEQAVVGI